MFCVLSLVTLARVNKDTSPGWVLSWSWGGRRDAGGWGGGGGVEEKKGAVWCQVHGGEGMEMITLFFFFFLLPRPDARWERTLLIPPVSR